MLKLAGCILIMTGAFGTGWALCKKMEERISQLELLHNAFSIVESEVDYNRSILQDGFKKAGERVGGNLGIRFRRMWERMEDGQGQLFEEIWKEEMSNWMSESSLKVSEKDLIINFSRFIGMADAGIQTRQLQLIKMELQEMKRLAQGEQRSKKQMIMSVSVTGGLFVVLLLL